MYGKETAERQYSEYSENYFTQREPEYYQDTDRHRRKSTQIRWGGRDGRREPDSGLGYTQDCHSQWRMADKEHGTEGRLTGDRIPEIAGMRRNSQWAFPRRRALFTSDGTYSISSESDTTEGYVDRPPEVEYVAGRRTEERQDEDDMEGLGFPHKTLERAVTQLQKELDDCRTEFEITRRMTSAPAVNRRQPRQPRQLTPFPFVVQACE